MTQFSFILMLYLMVLSNLPNQQNQDQLCIDFGTDPEKTKSWQRVNDGVMGGRSTGNINLLTNSLLFEGSISFENNGGFASFRSPYKAFDLSNYKQVKIRYRSVGQTFALQLNQYRIFYYPNYRLYLEKSSDENEWIEATFPIAAFMQYRMGNKSGGSIDLSSLEKTIQLGFITTEKKEGPFSFEIDYLLFE